MTQRRAAALRLAAKTIMLGVIATLAGLGLGEVVVRLVAPQQLVVQRPELFRPMDSLGYAHRPNVHLSVNTGDRTVTVHTDGSGFRVGADGRPPGDYRLLLLGDSFMAAMQVEYQESLAGLVERCFADRTGKSVAVWNTGVAGWDPPQYYLQARRALETWPFEVAVVAVFLGNDVADGLAVLPPREADQRHPFRVPKRLTQDEVVDAVLYPANDVLEANSHVFLFFKNRSQALLMRLGLTTIDIPAVLRRSEAGSARWGRTADMLAQIDSLASARGIPTVFVLIPAIEQVVPRVFEERAEAFGIDPDVFDLEQPERLMAVELQARGLHFVSLLPALRAAERRGAALYGRVDWHPSAEGHQVMWKVVGPAIAQALGFTYSDAPSDDPGCRSR